MPKTNPFDRALAERLRDMVADESLSDARRLAASAMLWSLPSDITASVGDIPVTFPLKFYAGQRVVHVKSQGVYSVVGLPTVFRVECTGEPAYAYMADGVVWVRGQSEFEDGRFVSAGEWEAQQAPQAPSSVVCGRFNTGRFGEDLTKDSETESDLYHGVGAAVLLSEAG